MSRNSIRWLTYGFAEHYLKYVLNSQRVSRALAGVDIVQVDYVQALSRILPRDAICA